MLKMMKEEDIPNQEKIWDELAESWDERRKRVGPRILKFVKNAKGNLLDLGCGSGRHVIKNDKATFYLVDFSEKMLDLAEEKAKKLKVKYKTIKSDVSDLSFFEENFFDKAIYIATLHCLTTAEKRKKSLKELYRIMKPKAEAFIAVWNNQSSSFERFKNKKEILLAWNCGGKRNLRYYYFYDKQELIDLLKEAGFKIKELLDNKEDTGLFAIVEK